jgi:hypothetical protein
VVDLAALVVVIVAVLFVYGEVETLVRERYARRRRLRAQLRRINWYRT